MEEYFDIIGRPLNVGDHVVFYDNIYRVVGFKGKRDVQIFLINPSVTSKKIWVLHRRLTLLPEQDVIMWLLKKPTN